MFLYPDSSFQIFTHIRAAAAVTAVYKICYIWRILAKQDTSIETEQIYISLLF